jgi:Tfp pilus assembly protein PilN
MKPVNLLPTKDRPRTPTGTKQGSSYVVIGVLGAILVMTLIYVTTVNDINSRKGAVAKAKAETVQAQARADSLASYGNFRQVKQERVSSVQQLAGGRVDWERLARGLARVLPGGVWLLTASASASGTPSASGASSPASSTPATPSSGSAAGAGAGPQVELTGCAPSEPVVAATLVRLRELSGAQDVQLNDMTQPDTPTATGGAPSGSTPPSGGSAASGDCGRSHGKTNYKWDATVIFAPVSSSQTSNEKVPASLGGGS